MNQVITHSIEVLKLICEVVAVYCPACEAPVEAAATSCGNCNHSLSVQGPVTASGHDLNELRNFVRNREDLSMAEKFSYIAQLEEGADPVAMGFATAASENDSDSTSPLKEQAQVTPSPVINRPPISDRYATIGLPLASAAADLVLGEGISVKSETIDAIITTSGSVDLGSFWMLDAMRSGLHAAHHIDDVARGLIPASETPTLADVPSLSEPERSFCPRCGSDIVSHAQKLWNKCNQANETVTAAQIESSLQVALSHIAAHYLQAISQIRETLATEGLDPVTIKEEIMNEISEEHSKEITTLTQEISELKKSLEDAKSQVPSKSVVSDDENTTEAEDVVNLTDMTVAELKTLATERGLSGFSKLNKAQLITMIEEGVSPESLNESKEETPKTPSKKPEKKVTTPPKSGGGLFGGPKRPKKSFDGDEEDKKEWFLNEALDTVYDPHGTGKSLKRKTILARSSEGNVRVQDVIEAYVEGGEENISELALTSPWTKYIVEAYESC